MARLKKMLGSSKSPYILSLMSVVEAQTKSIIANWALDYAEINVLPIYLKYYPEDGRPQSAIFAARSWLRGDIPLPKVKDIILNSCHQAAREAEKNPAAQAAARAIGQAAATIHVKTHSLGVALYGAAAIAYDRYGIEKSAEFYNKIAAEACADMERNLQAIVEPRKR